MDRLETILMTVLLGVPVVLTVVLLGGGEAIVNKIKELRK